MCGDVSYADLNVQENFVADTALFHLQCGLVNHLIETSNRLDNFPRNTMSQQ